MVFMGKLRHAGIAADSGIPFLYHTSNSLYRIDANGNFRRVRTSDSNFLESRYLGGTLTLRELMGLILIISSVSLVVAGNRAQLFFARIRQAFLAQR